MLPLIKSVVPFMVVVKEEVPKRLQGNNIFMKERVHDALIAFSGDTKVRRWSK